MDYICKKTSVEVSGCFDRAGSNALAFDVREEDLEDDEKRRNG